MLNTHMKDTLRKGKPVFGTFLKCNSPALIETYGRAGFDFVILDAEHGTYTFSEAENLVRTADSVNLSSIIRIPDCTEASVLHGLDIGASGVQVPSLIRVEDARYGAQFSRYYPDGIRGLSFDQRSADYGMIPDIQGYMKHANANVSFIVQVEKKEMVERVEELCQIPQLDIIFIGPGDLSQSLGKPGQMGHPEVLAAIKHVTEVALKNNIYVGCITLEEKQVKEFVDMGMQYICWSTDMMMYAAAIRQAASIFSPYK